MWQNWKSKSFPKEQGNCSCKTPSSEMGQPIFLRTSTVWTKPAHWKGVKHYLVKWQNPIFLEQSVHSARRVDKASARKGVKHLRGKWIKNPSSSALGPCSQVLPRYRYLKYHEIHLRKRSIAVKQALRWQILAPIGTSGMSRMGAPSTDEPQLTSKVVFLVMKQERLDDSGFVALAA